MSTFVSIASNYEHPILLETTDVQSARLFYLLHEAYVCAFIRLHSDLAPKPLTHEEISHITASTGTGKAVKHSHFTFNIQ